MFHYSYFSLICFISVFCVSLQVFRRPWPGIMRTVYENHERFENTYFKKFPGFYVTGDGMPQKTSITFSAWTLKFTRPQCKLYAGSVLIPKMYTMLSLVFSSLRMQAGQRRLLLDHGEDRRHAECVR